MSKTTMFNDVDKYFEDYSRNARTAFAWVYPVDVRNLLEKVVDLQVESGKVAVKITRDLVDRYATK